MRVIAGNGSIKSLYLGLSFPSSCLTCWYFVQRVTACACNKYFVSEDVSKLPYYRILKMFFAIT